jgi:hypothetical protein
MPQLIPAFAAALGGVVINGALALGLGALLPAASAYAIGGAILSLGNSTGATFCQPGARK